MSADALLRGVADAAEDLRHRSAPIDLARLVERPSSTITRRDSVDVIDWPARDMLRMARRDDRLAASIQSYLTGAITPTGDARAIGADLVAEIEASAQVASVAMRALADGRLDLREISEIEAAGEKARVGLDRLLRDLAAARREARV